MANSPILSLSHFSKTFHEVTVLHDLTLEIQRGEVHALLGENGSGKSTLVKILSGFHDPDEGAEMALDGVPVKFPIVADDARRLGLEFVHQTLGLAPSMSVTDNLRVGHYDTRLFGMINWRREHARARQLLAETAHDIDVASPVGSLPTLADHALIAIARALEASRRRRDHGGVIVLDEPTVYLPGPDAERLLTSVRRLADSGLSVLYVTHRLEELDGFADRVSVLRNGRLVGTLDVADTDEAGLVRMIVGDAGIEPAQKLRPGPSEAAPLLEVRGLTGERVTDFSLTLRAGEVVGIAGLSGMGHEHIPSLIFGGRKPQRGTVVVDNRVVRTGRPRASIAAGLVLVPDNRSTRAVFLEQSVEQNLTFPVLRSYFVKGFLRPNRESADAMGHVGAFDIRPQDARVQIQKLSGGNQQKAVLAKWMQIKPRVILLEEPTQGVDVGARAGIVRRLRDAAASGAGVVVASSDYGLLADLCDRVLILRDGAVVAELTGSDVTRAEIAARCYRSGGAAD